MGGSRCCLWNHGWRAWDLIVLVLGPLQVPIWAYIPVWTLLPACLIMTNFQGLFVLQGTAVMKCLCYSVNINQWASASTLEYIPYLIYIGTIRKRLTKELCTKVPCTAQAILQAGSQLLALLLVSSLSAVAAAGCLPPLALPRAWLALWGHCCSNAMAMLQ